MSLPLYINIAEKIIRKIQNNELNEGEKLPAERHLAEMFSVSRSTIRSSLKYLEDLGIIETFHGAGHFVKTQKIYISLNTFYSFDIETERQNFKIKNKVFDAHTYIPSKDVKDIMGISNFTLIHYFKRVRVIGNIPVMVQDHHINHEVYPHIDFNVLNEIPLYDYLQDKFNKSPSKGVETITTVIPPVEIQKLLKIKPDIPVIVIERLAYVEGVVAEYTISYLKPEKYSFILNLEDKKSV